MKKYEHRLVYAGFALAYGAGCIGLDKIAVQALAAGFYLLLALRG